MEEKKKGESTMGETVWEEEFKRQKDGKREKKKEVKD